MSKIRVRYKSRLKDKIDSLKKSLSDQIYDTGENIAVEMQNNIREKMLHGYNEPHGKDRHTAIYDTGALYKSVNAQSLPIGDEMIEITAWADTPYAVYVHEGTHKLHGRPFILDSLNDNKQDLIDNIEKELKDFFDKM